MLPEGITPPPPPPVSAALPPTGLNPFEKRGTVALLVRRGFLPDSEMSAKVAESCSKSLALITLPITLRFIGDREEESLVFLGSVSMISVDVSIETSFKGAFSSTSAHEFNHEINLHSISKYSQQHALLIRPV